MLRVLNNEQMRAADEYTIKQAGVSSAVLMRRAGKAIAEETAKVAKERCMHRILVVCGKGNNGGDGYVCAEELLCRGFDVKVYAFNGKLSEDCKRERAAYSGGYATEICGDIIVDCIFGTGLCREVSGTYAEIISSINRGKAFVVAADIPSGVNGDNGRVLGCAVKADLTVAIAEYKVGHFIADGADYCGKIVKKDIGIICPDSGFARIYEEEDLRIFYPQRRRNTHKGSYGTANIVAGSEAYIGAAALAVDAALRSGCGYVKLTACNAVKNSLAALYPQAVYLGEADYSADCIAVGSGCGVGERLYAKIAEILREYKGKLVIDADGLNSLAKFGTEILKEHRCEVMLTPHVKEFSRLTGKAVGEILSDPIKSAENFAQEYGVSLILKSSSSVITDGQKTVINTRGNTVLAKAGSGDMLTGFLCGSAARGLSLFDAAVCASNTIGLAAELVAAEYTEYCGTAKDILKNLFLSVKRLTV